ncbi:2TM domain-containing protein [Flavobacterium caeni]|uniref:2TM domain-containing protein n=1 Tax=Flavobacterium caeni TaxID=490189 RepID=A0A1G5AUS9_9FLAO|nr:2TM domain-containing protein [Flavobacterium caeni]SCX81613.1 2TM domain-containing protein [Flavobacterium caeni]
MENNLEQLQRERAQKRVKALAGFYKHLAVYLLVNGFLIALKYFNLDPGEQFFEFGTFSTAFFWGIGLGFHALSVFGPNVFLGSDWEERKIKEIMEREKRNKWE